VPDIGPRDLADANDHYNARLTAAGVPDEGTKQVVGALLNGDLFDGEDGAAVAVMLGENYSSEMVEALAQVTAVASVHSMALGVIAERKRWESVRQRVARFELALREIAGDGFESRHDAVEIALGALNGEG
jgi:hypothetical protein